MDSAVTPLGPLLSADRIYVTVTGSDKVPYELEIFPDANNVLLQQNGLPQQYYFMPKVIYVAKRQEDPADFDFGMTVFKGLMDSEDTIGVNPGQGTGSGDVEVGGGFCTFSTTFAIPPDVIQSATAMIKAQSFPGQTISSWTQPYMPAFRQNEPDPILGIVPILGNDVSIFVQQNAPGTTGANGLWMSAQSAAKGSIEASGISSFLVSCNEFAAGEIAGSLKTGNVPFVVNYLLTEQFYLPACEIDVDIDLDKTYESFSMAIEASGFFTSASFQAAWSECAINGSINTTMKVNEAALPADLKTLVTQEVQQMQTNAINLVKDFIFDWNPSDGGDAQASSTPFGSIFGGASVSMKLNYQKRSIHMPQTFTLETSVAITDGKQGDLSDLMPAVKADINKYLAIVDIGQFFQKIQVASTNAINWKETLPDGTNLSDPIMSAMVSVSYPDYDQPLNADKTVNLKTLGQGYHYITGQQTGTDGLAQWNSNNPVDVINISFMKLDTTNSISQWPSDQVQVTKTLIFDGNDPRVDLTNNQTQYVVTTTDNNHTPVLDMNAVGYVFVRFMVRPLPTAVTLVVNTTLGARNDSITITSANQKSAIWEIFSDKYVGETSFTYTVQVTVQGPNFTDNPIVYQSDQPITVALPPGRVKYNPLLSLQLPDAPADQVATINQYILNYQKANPVGSLVHAAK